MIRATVITVSDSVAEGTREDRSGPALAARLTEAGFSVDPVIVVPDDIASIAAALLGGSGGGTKLLVTTGGTGFGPRDITPEATRSVLDREAAALAATMQTGHPMAALSRGLAGTIGSCLVLNLPGSTSGAIESIEQVLSLIPHALELLDGGSPH